MMLVLARLDSHPLMGSCSFLFSFLFFLALFASSAAPMGDWVFFFFLSPVFTVFSGCSCVHV